MKLNLGAGEFPLEGYENLDRKTGQEIYPLAYEDESVDEVRASHVLEHFSHKQALPVLRDWVRVLKPGGVLKVAVPDLEWIARNYLEGVEFPIQEYLMGSHVDGDDHHGTVWDRPLLANTLRHIGLTEIAPWQSDTKDCAALPVSLNIQGMKPGPLPKFKIAGAMSVPRLGFQDNFFCWVQLANIGIVPTKYDGAFWGQCLERVMSDALDSDYILTVDYDSVFNKATVERMIRLAARHPDADAIAPIQVKRGGGLPLMTIKEDGEFKREIRRDAFYGDLLKVDTAHFGLTLIKTEALKKMPHPWFLGVPNADGEWGEGRIDDDIYFWQKWQEHGNSLYVAPRCVVGHGQFMVTWPNENFEPIYQHPKDFWASGIPEGAWQ